MYLCLYALVYLCVKILHYAHFHQFVIKTNTILPYQVSAVVHVGFFFLQSQIIHMSFLSPFPKGPSPT